MQVVFLFHKNLVPPGRAFHPEKEDAPLFVEYQVPVKQQETGETMRPKTPDHEKLDDGVRVRLTALEKQLLLKALQKGRLPDLE